MNWKNTWLYMGVGLLRFAAPAAAQTNPLTLEEALSLVELHSKEIGLGELRTVISEQTLQQAEASQLPSLSVFAAVDKATNMPVYENGLFTNPTQHEVVHTLYSTGANLYLNLFEGYKVKNEIRLAEIESEESRVELAKRTSLTKLKAVHLFVDLYLQQEWRKTMLDDIYEKEQELKEIERINQAGIVLESDVLRAALELSKRKMTLVEIENSILVIQQQLNVLLGNRDDYPLLPQVDFSELEKHPMTLEQALVDGLEEGFDTELSHLHTEAAETILRLNKANYYPKLGLTGSFQFSNPQIFLYPYNLSWYDLGILGLRASYSISSLYHNRHQVERATLALDREKLHHEAVNDEVRTRIYKSYYAYDEAQKNQKVSEQNQAYADENARIVKNAYFGQTALITDLLDANLLQVKAKFELEQARVTTLKNLYTLKHETGRL